MRQLGELVERRVQMIYLTATLSSYIKLKFINIIRIKDDDIYIFQSLTSRSNIAYFIVKYKKDEFERGDIIIVYKLMEQKLKEYAALTKIIIYNSSIVII